MKLLKYKLLKKIKARCKKVKNHKLWLDIVQLLEVARKAKRMKRVLRYLKDRTKGESDFPSSCVFAVTQSVLECQ